jgi:hypothetical protein
MRHTFAPAFAPIVALLGTWLSLSALPASAQELELVPGSTVPRVQLTGEHFQIQSDGVYFATETQSRTLTTSGLTGTDLGRPLTIGDRIFLFFGDSGGGYLNGGRYFASRGVPAGSSDAIGVLPNADFSACRYIESIAATLVPGRQPVGDMTGCPKLSVLLNPFRAFNEHVFKPLVIDGLEEGENTGIFRVPSAVIEHNDAVYVFATTLFQDEREAFGGTAAFWRQSVLAKSTQPATVWNDSNPPAFKRLYTVSSHAEIEDPLRPPPIEDAGGKFMGVSTLVMPVGEIADLGLTRFLPRNLQTSDVVFVWGRGWNPRSSDMYLAAFAKNDIEAGTRAWQYYAGNGTWSPDEARAVGLLGSTDVSQQHVTWNAALGRFVLMRGATGRIAAQFSTTPWGPWSGPSTVINNDDAWFAKLLHRPGEDSIVHELVPIYAADGKTVVEAPDERGVPYSPNVLDRYTVNGDGSVTLFYTVSTWYPYQVFLVSSTFRTVVPPPPPPPPPPAPAPAPPPRRRP